MIGAFPALISASASQLRDRVPGCLLTNKSTFFPITLPNRTFGHDHCCPALGSLATVARHGRTPCSQRRVVFRKAGVRLRAHSFAAANWPPNSAPTTCINKALADTDQHITDPLRAAAYKAAKGKNLVADKPSRSISVGSQAGRRCHPARPPKQPANPQAATTKAIAAHSPIRQTAGAASRRGGSRSGGRNRLRRADLCPSRPAVYRAADRSCPG